MFHQAEEKCHQMLMKVKTYPITKMEREEILKDELMI